MRCSQPVCLLAIHTICIKPAFQSQTRASIVGDSEISDDIQHSRGQAKGLNQRTAQRNRLLVHAPSSLPPPAQADPDFEAQAAEEMQLEDNVALSDSEEDDSSSTVSSSSTSSWTSSESDSDSDADSAAQEDDAGSGLAKLEALAAKAAADIRAQKEAKKAADREEIESGADLISLGGAAAQTSSSKGKGKERQTDGALPADIAQANEVSKRKNRMYTHGLANSAQQLDRSFDKLASGSVVAEDAGLTGRSAKRARQEVSCVSPICMRAA